MGVSENSVPCTPFSPMVLLIIIPIKWLFHWEYTQHFQTNPYIHIIYDSDEAAILPGRQRSAVWKRVPSGKHTKSYRKWPFIVSFPIKNGDFQ